MLVSYFKFAWPHVAWVSFFMRYRRELDIKRFSQSAIEQSKMIQLVQGMSKTYKILLILTFFNVFSPLLFVEADLSYKFATDYD